MRLNLEAATKEEQKIKAYLEANASETLAEKINNGVRIQKDGKTLLNKKTLSGFMKYACDEAKKQAEKGAHSACIDDDVVYGWAAHYFEEDGIEGMLYNEDGAEYKIQPKAAAKALVVKHAQPKPQPKPQLSMFDLLDNSDNSGISAVQSINDDEPTEEELREAAEQIAAEEKAEQPKPAISPVYQKYLDVQGKYPQAIIAMRLGDFYEVFGKNAECLQTNCPLPLPHGTAASKAVFLWSVFLITLRMRISKKYLQTDTLSSSSKTTAPANCLPPIPLTLKRARYFPKRICANQTEMLTRYPPYRVFCPTTRQNKSRTASLQRTLPTSLTAKTTLTYPPSIRKPSRI